MPRTLGDLTGIWRTRNGSFVKLVKLITTDTMFGKLITYPGWLLDEDGKKISRIHYFTPDCIEDQGLDLMERRRGEESGWPIVVEDSHLDQP